jgi:hypothetical protein
MNEANGNGGGRFRQWGGRALFIRASRIVPGLLGAATPSGSWPYPNGDLANTRDAAGSVITTVNVSKLKEAWSPGGKAEFRPLGLHVHALG